MVYTRFERGAGSGCAVCLANFEVVSPLVADCCFFESHGVRCGPLNHGLLAY